MGRQVSRAIHTPFAHIDFIALRHAGKPHPTIHQLKLLTQRLNNITNAARPQGTIWGYEGGRGLVLGTVNAGGNFVPFTRPTLSKKEYHAIADAIARDYIDSNYGFPNPTSPKKRHDRETDKLMISYDPEKFIVNMGLQTRGFVQTAWKRAQSLLECVGEAVFMAHSSMTHGSRLQHWPRAFSTSARTSAKAPPVPLAL